MKQDAYLILLVCPGRNACQEEKRNPAPGLFLTGQCRPATDYAPGGGMSERLLVLFGALRAIKPPLEDTPYAVVEETNIIQFLLPYKQHIIQVRTSRQTQQQISHGQQPWHPQNPSPAPRSTRAMTFFLVGFRGSFTAQDFELSLRLGTQSLT